MRGERLADAGQHSSVNRVRAGPQLGDGYRRANTGWRIYTEVIHQALSPAQANPHPLLGRPAA